MLALMYCVDKVTFGWPGVCASRLRSSRDGSELVNVIGTGPVGFCPRSVTGTNVARLYPSLAGFIEIFGGCIWMVSGARLRSAPASTWIDTTASPFESVWVGT